MMRSSAASLFKDKRRSMKSRGYIEAQNRVEQQFVTKKWVKWSPAWAEDFRKQQSIRAVKHCDMDRQIAVGRFLTFDPMSSHDDSRATFRFARRAPGWLNWGAGDLDMRDVWLQPARLQPPTTDRDEQEHKLLSGEENVGAAKAEASSADLLFDAMEDISPPSVDTPSAALVRVSTDTDDAPAIVSEEKVLVGVPVSCHCVHPHSVVKAIRNAFPTDLPSTRFFLASPHSAMATNVFTLLVSVTPTELELLRQCCEKQTIHVPGTSNAYVGEFIPSEVLTRPREPITTTQLAPIGFSSSGNAEEEGKHDSIDADEPLVCPPATEYRVMLRTVDPSTPMGTLIQQAELVQQIGFLNYSSSWAHGMHSYKSYNVAKLILDRKYVEAVVGYCELLGYGWGPNVRGTLRRLRDSVIESEGGYKQSVVWEHAAEDLALAVKEYKTSAKDNHGISIANLLMLQKTIESIAAMRVKDGAAMLREVVGKDTVALLLRTLADVIWNAVASLREELYGRHVVVGDLVCTDRSLFWDVTPSPAFDHLISPRMLHDPTPYNTYMNERAPSLLKIVRSEAEAKQYDLCDVVLPKPGRLSREMVSLFPSNKCGTDAYDTVIRSFGLTGFLEMKLAPLATYRRLVVKPGMWEESGGGTASNSHTGKHLAVDVWDDEKHFHLSTGKLKSQASDGGRHEGGGVLTLFDRYEMRRLEMPSPLLPHTRIRGGIHSELWHEFLNTGKAGLTVGVRTTLPPGAALSSLLREIVVPELLPNQRFLKMVQGPDSDKRNFGLREESGAGSGFAPQAQYRKPNRKGRADFF